MAEQEFAEAAPGFEISIFDLLQVIAENLRLIVFGSLLVGLVALGIGYLLTPKYTARTTFLPPAQQQGAAALMLQSLGPLAGLAVGGPLANPGERYVALVESNSVRDALVDRFNLMRRYDAQFREDARKRIGSQAKVSSSKNGLITVEIEDADPKFAADVANAHVEELTRMLGRLDVTEAQARRSFYEQQLKKTKDGLVTAELALKRTGINESAIKASPIAAVGGVATLMAQVAAKEVELAAMRGSLTENAPDFKRAQAELGALRVQLSRVDREESPASGGSDYVSKYRNFKYYETLYELVAKQYEAARIDESRDGSVIQVVDRALPPERRSSPKKAQIAVLSTLLAGFVLVLFVFVRHVLRSMDVDPQSGPRLAALRQSLRRAFWK